MTFKGLLGLVSVFLVTAAIWGASSSGWPKCCLPLP